MEIAVSTGWLFARGVNCLMEHQKVCRDANADGMEIHLCQTRRELFFKQYKHIPAFKHMTVHLSPIQNEQDLADSKRALEMAQCVIHTTHRTMEFLEELPNFDRLCIENLDKKNTQATSIVELSEILDKFPSLGLTLDIQHAFEHDKTLAYGKQLVDLFLPRIRNLHVSGENEKTIHSLVKDSSNQNAIIELMRYVLDRKDLPIVLEGEFSTVQDLKEEIAFIRSVM
ncbi:MAG: hypothetical protein ACQESG_06975 [Nanobdellota archaeon]